MAKCPRCNGILSCDGRSYYRAKMIHCESPDCGWGRLRWTCASDEWWWKKLDQFHRNHPVIGLEPYLDMGSCADMPDYPEEE
ncbi:MAG TPA: hypothetical protein VMW24_25005 [Sedimentisphaerales bacterium]|nr:hypothetical protein [Sedimentisphaerales bacterium]